MAVVWTYLRGGPAYSLSLINGAFLSDRTLLSASSTKFTYEVHSFGVTQGTVRFEGDIDLDGGNNPVGGTIHTLRFYDDDSTLVAKATGYSIDVADLIFALAHLDNFASQYMALIAEKPGTFNGSDEKDVIIDPDSFGGPANDSTLYGNKGVDFLQAGRGDDKVFGGDGSDTLHGERGVDKVYGGNGRDALYGEEGNDQLSGGSDHDELFGFKGNDTLTGGGSYDYFIHSGALNADTNVDTFTDFTEADTIVLYNTFCPDIGDEGPLDGGRLRIGTKAKDASDRVIYDDDTGKLYYDHDGLNGDKQILFAKISKHFSLDSSDFDIIVF